MYLSEKNILSLPTALKKRIVAKSVLHNGVWKITEVMYQLDSHDFRLWQGWKECVLTDASETEAFCEELSAFACTSDRIAYLFDAIQKGLAFDNLTILVRRHEVVFAHLAEAA